MEDKNKEDVIKEGECVVLSSSWRILSVRLQNIYCFSNTPLDGGNL